MNRDHPFERFLSAARHLPRTMRFRLRLASVLAAALFVPTGLAGGTSSGWLSPSPIPGKGGPVDIAMDASGNTIAVWPDDGVRAATRSVGTTWRTEPVTPTGGGWPIAVEVDGRGTTTVMWGENAPTVGSWSLEAATRPAGGRFGQPELVATLRGTTYQFKLAVGPRGDAVAVWQRRDREVELTPQVEAAVRPAGGSFGPVQRLGEARRETQPADAAVDAMGNVIVAWRGLTDDPPPDATTSVAYARRGGPLRAETPPAGLDFSSEVAFDGAGNATGLGTGAQGIGSVVRTVSGVWRAPRFIGAPTVQFPRLAVDADGTAHAVWTTPPGPVGVWAAERLEPSGPWGRPTLVAQEPIQALILSLAESAGNMIVTWWGSQGEWRASVRSAAGGWSPSFVFGTGCSPTDLAIDAHGNATVSCERDVTGYDGSGPLLRNLSVPRAGRKGKPVRFAVSPVDVWSRVVKTRWTFGDGRGATGRRVTHEFRRPGGFRVTVTSTDSRGHTTTATRRIRIH